MATVLLAAALAAPVPKDSPPPTTLDQLQGRWIGEAYTDSGNADPPEKARKFAVTFDGDEMTFTVGTVSVVNVVTVRPRRTPAAIDFLDEDGKEVLNLGIYKREGDTLTLCYTLRGSLHLEEKHRPKEFAAPFGSSRALLVLRRSSLCGYRSRRSSRRSIRRAWPGVSP